MVYHLASNLTPRLPHRWYTTHTTHSSNRSMIPAIALAANARVTVRTSDNRPAIHRIETGNSISSTVMALDITASYRTARAIVVGVVRRVVVDVALPPGQGSMTVYAGFTGEYERGESCIVGVDKGADHGESIAAVVTMACCAHVDPGADGLVDVLAFMVTIICCAPLSVRCRKLRVFAVMKCFAQDQFD